MKYGELTLGQVEAVVNKLGGIGGVKRLLSGELIVTARQPVWQIWKTIQLGTGLKTAGEFREALKKAGDLIQDIGGGILDKEDFIKSINDNKIDAELVVVSVRQLGFKKNATLREIYDRAKELGLDLCPAEAGPQLRLQYEDQPKGESFMIAMEPIITRSGDPVVFVVGRFILDNRRYLSLTGTHPDDQPREFEDPFVFLRRK